MIKVAKKSKVESFKQYRDEIIRHFDVVAEDRDSKIAVIAEQYGDIHKNIDSIKATVESNTEMIGKLATDMTIVKEQVEIISSGLKRKVDFEEFAALQRRVSALEKSRK